MKIFNSKKKKIIAIIAVFFGMIYFSKEYYFNKLLRENLPVEFKSSEVSILRKKITLTQVKYAGQSETNVDTYSVDKMKTQIESIDFQDKEAVIEKVTLDGFSFKRENKIPGYGVIPSEASQTKLETPSETQGETTTEKVSQAQPKEKKSKNPFKRFLKTVEKTIGEGTAKVTDIIDEKWLQTNIDKFISDYLREKLIENSINGDELIKKVSERIEEEHKNPNLWSVHIKELEVNANVLGEEITGTILNLKNKVSDMTEPVTLKFANEDDGNHIEGTIFIPTLSGEIALNFKNFNYKAIPQLEKYLKNAHVGVVQKSFYNEGNAVTKGVLIVKDAKLNVPLILDEFVKSEKLSEDDVRVKALGFALERIHNMKLEYIFNSKTGELQIRTDIVEQIKKILTENFFQVAKEVI